MTMYSPDNPELLRIEPGSYRPSRTVAEISESADAQKNRYVKWQEDEDNYLRQNYHKMGSSWCAQHLGRSRGTVRLRAHKLGISIPKFLENTTDAT